MRHQFTGWLRRVQGLLLIASQSTLNLGNAFEWWDWTEIQTIAVQAAVIAWLAVFVGQNVDTRALKEAVAPTVEDPEPLLPPWEDETGQA